MVKKLLFSSVVISLIAYAGAGPLGPPQADQLLTPGQPAGKMSVSDGLGGSAYQTAGSVSTPAPVGASPNANGITITGANINLEPASASFPGVVTTGAQTLAGDKTFNGLQIHGADGSVTAPKITWTGDTDTGFYRAGSGQVSLPLNGSTTSAGIARKIDFQDLNTVIPASNLGTGIFQHAPYSYYSAGLEGVLASGQLHIAAGGLGSAMQGTFESGGANANGPVMNLWKNRGTTPTARVAVNSADVLGTYTFVGSTTSALQRTGAHFRATTTENWSETNRGTQLGIFTNPTATNTLTEAVRFEGNNDTTFTKGNVNIGVGLLAQALLPTPQAVSNPLLHVVGTVGNPAQIFVENVVENTNGANIYLAKGRGGSTTTRTAPIASDVLGTVRFAGWPTSSTLGEGALVRSQTSENWSATNQGSHLDFYNILTGTATVTHALRISGNGELSLRRASGANITWVTDGAGSIGASGANRPASGFFSVGLTAPTITSTTQFLSADGSAATPSISFSSNTGQGFFKGSSGTGFTAGGSERWRFTTSGNLEAVVGGSIQATDRVGAGTGYSIAVKGGNAGSSGNGGSLFLQSGLPTNGSGGAILVSTTDGNSAAGAGGLFRVITGNGNGTGAGGDIELRTGTGSLPGQILFRIGGVQKWVVDTNGHLVPNTSSEVDLGSPSVFVRTGYFGTGGIRIEEGSNARQSTCTLVAGTCTIANASVAADDRIYCTSQVDGGTPGFLRVSARNVGTDFTVTSGSALDTSDVACLLVGAN